MAIDASAAAEILASRKRQRLQWKALYSSDTLISFMGFVLLACMWEVAVYLFEKLLKLLPVLLQIQVLAHLAKQCTKKRGPVAVAGQQVL